MMPDKSWCPNRLEDAELPSSESESQIMGMAHSSTIWTADQVRALPYDGKRYETVAGELLVTPAPGVPHQRAVGELMGLLRSGIPAGAGLEILPSPADIELDDRTLVQPDLFITPRIEGENQTWEGVRPILAIEVLSPSSARYDRVTKRRRYQREGIEYWIVDLDSRIIERWRGGDERPEIITERIEWRPTEYPATCSIDIVRFFQSVLG
jgi:Uma2 family endonuclease